MRNILKRRKFESVYKVNNLLNTDPEYHDRIFVSRVKNESVAEKAFDNQKCIEISINEDNVFESK